MSRAKLILFLTLGLAIGGYDFAGTNRRYFYRYGPVRPAVRQVKVVPMQYIVRPPVTQVRVMSKQQPVRPQARQVRVRPKQQPVRRVEANLGCGRVPIYERLYRRSVNTTLFRSDPNSGSFRILHGLDAVTNEWPWIVKIKLCSKPSCGSCTGTLLNSRWVISAGHCGSRPAQDYVVTLGLYNLVAPESTSFEAKFDRVVRHPDYKDLNNDLTLFRLSQPVAFNDRIQPACLIGPTRNILGYAVGKSCITLGYGLVHNMMSTVRLQKMPIVVMQPSACNSDKLDSVQLRPNTVCVGPLRGRIGGSCKGDSGGPDLCYDAKSNRWSIFGTVSYGPADCDREQGDRWLTVSVDLSSFRRWIMSVISEV